MHSHGLALHALGMMGSALLEMDPENWRVSLSHLDDIDWTRRNTTLWEGRALVAGRVSKATNNVKLTASFLKTRLGLALTKEDKMLEASLRGDD